MDESKQVWTTEDGRRVKVADMPMSHLHNALTFLENKLATVVEKLGYLDAPLPADMRLTEEATIEVYMLKCEKLLLIRWQGILQGEVERRRVEMNKGFSVILNAARGFHTHDDDGKPLPAMLQRQAD